MLVNAFSTLITDPLYNGLIFLVSVVPFGDVGVAVVVLTALVKIILLPLAHKSIKTQAVVKRIDPEIKENEIIAIIDETHKKPLSIGKSLLDAETMQNTEKGKVIKNIHWIGDPLWNG